MKTIDELGISNTPWHAFEDNWIESADSNPVMSNAAYAGNQNDARLIAAAPELYDALSRIVASADDSVGDFAKWRENLHDALRDARKALAKASGGEA